MANKTNVYIDSEFLEDGTTIELISIAYVDENGAAYYAVNADMPVDRIRTHDWLCKNVVPHLPLVNKAEVDERVKVATTPVVGTGNLPDPFGPMNPLLFELDRSSTLVRPKWVIANEVREFLGKRAPVTVWSWYSAYDHVAQAQLWGPMIKLPPHVPKRTRDLADFQEDLGILDEELPTPEPGANHDALADAKRHVRIHEFLKAEKKKRKA